MAPGDWLAVSADNATVALRSGLAGVATSALGAGRTYSQTTGAHPLPVTVGTLVTHVGASVVMVGVV